MQKFGPGIAPTFAYYFLCCTLISTAVGSQLLSSPFDPRAFTLGVPIAAIVGGLGAYFNHSKSIELAAKKPRDLQKNLENLLKDWKFEQINRADSDSLPKGTIVYQNTSPWRWMSGKVFVNIQGNRVSIASRSRLVDRIQKHLS